jgi:hypothetical protein
MYKLNNSLNQNYLDGRSEIIIDSENERNNNLFVLLNLTLAFNQ